MLIFINIHITIVIRGSIYKNEYSQGKLSSVKVDYSGPSPSPLFFFFLLEELLIIKEQTKKTLVIKRSTGIYKYITIVLN